MFLDPLDPKVIARRERIAQRAIFNFATKEMGLVTYHVPNGGRRDSEEARALHMDGVTRGVPDLHIAESFTHPVTGIFHPGTIIEVKSLKGKESEEQKSWAEHFRGLGYFVMSGWSGEQEVITTLSKIYTWRPLPEWFIKARTLKPRPPKNRSSHT